MGAFAEVFKDVCKKNTIPANNILDYDTIDITGTDDTAIVPDKMREVEKLRRDLEADGLVVTNLEGAGKQGIVFSIKGVQNGVLRLDRHNVHPMKDSTVLRAVASKQYGDYNAFIVPRGENAGEGMIEDFIRTIGVLEAKGKVGYKEINSKREYFSHFRDCDPTQTLNLKHDDDLIRYPNRRPVGFIHDLNGTGEELSQISKGYPSAADYFEDKYEKAKEIREDLAVRPDDEDLKNTIALFRAQSMKGKEIKDDKEFLDYMVSLLETAHAKPILKEIQQHYDPADAKQKKMIKTLRAQLTQVEQGLDDRAFVDKALASLTLHPEVAITQDDVRAFDLQGVATKRLRDELTPLIESGAMKLTLNPPEPWEQVPPSRQSEVKTTEIGGSKETELPPRG